MATTKKAGATGQAAAWPGSVPSVQLGVQDRPVVHVTRLVLNRHEAAAALGMSLPVFEAGVRAGTFPLPVKLSARRVGWPLISLQQAIERLPVSDCLPPPSKRG